MDLSLKILFILKNVWKYIKQEHYKFLKQNFIIKNIKKKLFLKLFSKIMFYEWFWKLSQIDPKFINTKNCVYVYEIIFLKF